MRAQEDNIKLVPPSNVSLNQDQNWINTPANINVYRAFLYSEVKRTSKNPVDIHQINQFIDSPEGQKGLALYISTRMQPKKSARPKSFGALLSKNLGIPISDQAAISEQYYE